MVGALDCTSRAIAVLRGLAGLSLVFSLGRDVTIRSSTSMTANPIRPSPPVNSIMPRRGFVYTIPQ